MQIYSLSTVATKYQLSIDKVGIIDQADNVDGFASTVTVWTRWIIIDICYSTSRSSCSHFFSCMYHVTLCWTILVTPPVRNFALFLPTLKVMTAERGAGKRATLRQQYTICSNSILLDHKMTGPGWFEMISLSTCPLPVSRSASRSSCYDCQPPILHIKNPSPCFRDFSSLTRQ